MRIRGSVAQKNLNFNVLQFADGSMGAVKGIAPDGSLVKTNEQVQEVWTGTTFGLAAVMLSEGLKDESFRAAGAFIARLRFGPWK